MEPKEPKKTDDANEKLRTVSGGPPIGLPVQLNTEVPDRPHAAIIIASDADGLCSLVSWTHNGYAGTHHNVSPGTDPGQWSEINAARGRTR